MKLFIAFVFFWTPFFLPAKVDRALYYSFFNQSLTRADSTYFFTLGDSLLKQLEEDYDPNIYVLVTGAMGLYLHVRSHHDQAIPYLKKALNVDAPKRFYTRSRCALALTSVYLSRGELPAAFRYLKRARELVKGKMNDRLKEYRVHKKRIQNAELQLYRELGLNGLVLEKLIRLLQNKQPYIYDVFRLGELYQSLNDLDNAIVYYKRVLKREKEDKLLNEKLKVYVLNRMGDAYFDKKEYNHALRYYMESQKLAESLKFNKYIWAAHLDRAFTYAHLSLVDSAKRELKALARVRYRPPLAERLGHLYAVKSMVANIEGKTDSAVILARRGLKLIESRRKNIEISDIRQAVFRTNQVNFEQMKYALYEKYQKEKNPVLIDSLYKYSILSRGRMYGEKSRPDTSARAYKEYLDACGDLEAFQLRQRLSGASFNDSLNEELSVRRFRLVETRIEMINKENATRYRPLPDLSELKIKMKKRNAALVIYDLNPHRPYAVFVGAGRTDLIPLSLNVGNLKDSLAAYVDQLFNDDGADGKVFNAELASFLYDRLWQPLVSRVSLPDDIMIIPDIDMAVLPFETLLSRKMPQKYYTSTEPAPYWERLLLQKHNFSYLPGIYSLGDTLSFTEPRALILGDPLIRSGENGPGLPSLNSDPLYYARAESEAVYDMIPASRLFLGKRATESAFLENADQYSIWHFATHARNDADYYNMSFIALSADSIRGKDGLLMAYEIQNMRRAPKLVTISACNSGVGPVLEGEGTLSLARFFMINDAENVIVTQWAVSDAYSARLMKAFYRGLIQEKIPSISRAFTRAKIIVARKGGTESDNYKHPSSWAAFRLYGDCPNVFVENKGYNRWWLLAILLFLFAGAVAFLRFRL